MRDELGLFYDVDHRTDLMDVSSVEERSDQDIQRPYNDFENKAHLFANQDARCATCGLMPGIKMMEVDHIQPRAKGGSDDLSNLQLLCGPCNSQKHAKDDKIFREHKVDEALNQLVASMGIGDSDAQNRTKESLLQIFKSLSK